MIFFLLSNKCLKSYIGKQLDQIDPDHTTGVKTKSFIQINTFYNLFKPQYLIISSCYLLPENMRAFNEMETSCARIHSWI